MDERHYARERGGQQATRMDQKMELRTFLEETQTRLEALGTAYLRRAARLREVLATLDAGADVPHSDVQAVCVLLAHWIDGA